MITVIIRDDGEDNVTRLTYENLWKELKDIPNSDLIVSQDWFSVLAKTKNDYVCLVEADCLVSEGYFVKQLKEIKTNPGRKISMLTAKTSVSRWNNSFFGYNIDHVYTQVIPNRSKKSSAAYPIEVGYMPGAIIRLSMLKEALLELGIKDPEDLVLLSTQLSLTFWRQGAGRAERKIQNGNPVYVNPNVNYCTTQEYVNDIGKFKIDTIDLQLKFQKESI